MAASRWAKQLSGDVIPIVQMPTHHKHVCLWPLADLPVDGSNAGFGG